MTATVINNTIQIKTWSKGANLGGITAQHDGWSTLAFDSNNPRESLKNELARFEDAEGQLTKQVQLKAHGKVAREAILNYKGANVIRTVRLGNNTASGENFAIDLKNQLYEIEKDLRAGSRIDLTLDCKEVALYARTTLGKLLRTTEFNGNYDASKALLKVFVRPVDGQNKEEILEALGPRLVYRSNHKVNNPVSNSNRWNWPSFGWLFYGITNLFSQKKSEELKEIKAILKQDTPYEEKRLDTIKKNLIKAGERLEQKRATLDSTNKDIKPLVIKIATIEELNIALVELRRLSQEYNVKGQQPLLVLNLPPEVKKFYKEVILKSKSQKMSTQESRQNSKNDLPKDDLEHFIDGVRERAFPSE